MPGKVKIGTHDGAFHCDEALACFMLKTLPRYKDAVIIRTRDASILDTCDIVVDVGNKYDPSKHRYDHHMRDFKESVSTVINKPGYDCKIKLSSAGLIYCHFGQEIIKQLFPALGDDDNLEIIYKKIYNTLIKEIDAIDNGLTMCEGEPEYRIVTCLSSRVSFLNPPWNSEGIDADKQFSKAMELTGREFVEHVKHAVEVWLPAREIVQDAIARRFEIDPSGEIIELSRGAPWIEHLFAIEKEQNIEKVLKYVIWKDDNYRVRCVPVEPSSFVCRLFLPEAWAGHRDQQLENACGIKGSLFVHTARFIGGHATREGAIAMAKKSLELGKAAT